MLLSQLSIGQTGYITEIANNCSIKERLQDMGFLKGTEIKCILKSPLGDPKGYFIRDSLIALRKKDTSKITVSEEATWD